MKTKVLSLIAIVSIVALSFAFTSAGKVDKKATKEVKQKNQDSEPIGGLASEDKF
jgi:hypothetical protein